MFCVYILSLPLSYSKDPQKLVCDYRQKKGEKGVRKAKGAFKAASCRKKRKIPLGEEFPFFCF
jgi:hypothetical protein